MEASEERKGVERRRQYPFSFLFNCNLKPYLTIMMTNHNYQLYLLSTFCQHLGHWFIHIASIVTVDRLSGGSSTALGKYIMTHTIPKIIFSPIGGVLADTFDRKHVMIVLDILGAIVVLGYLVAVRSENLSILYTASTCRATVHALYEPVTRSIVPLLVSNDQDLKRAVTINGAAWSGMLCIGGLAMGSISAMIGIEACYVIDSITYFMSAVVTCGLKGSFSVYVPVATKSTSNINKNSFSQEIRAILLRIRLPIQSFVLMSKGVLQYLTVCGFGLVVLLQPSAATVWGAADVLNASYAHVDGDEAATSRRLGLLSSCIGLGCLLGPMIANLFVDIDHPKSLQKVCVGALACMGSGWLGVSMSDRFVNVCFFTVVRTIGSGILWIDSTLLLQKLSAEDMLGRILSFEHSAALAGETTTAYITGRMRDAGYSNSEMALIASMLGFLMFSLWSIYHVYGGGAADPRFNDPIKRNAESQEGIEIGPLRQNPKLTFV